MEIKSGMFVAVSYKLHGIDGDATPEFIEETQDGNPLKFISGTGMMLESFEENLAGLKVGDKFDFVIKAEQAYGLPLEDHLVELPKAIFMVDGKFDDEVVTEGAILPMRDSEGHTLQGTVEAIKEDVVVMDFNHPMAGIDLHFTGEVLEVREPNEEDVQAINNAGGGCGGNCGCGDDCSSDSCSSGGGCGCH